jgi:predicted transcriptional regulator
MAKTKTYKDVKTFSKEVLGLDDYDSWLISTKNKIIASIVKARKQQSISQKELAEMLGTTQSVISRIEKGTSRSITLDYLMRVVTVLGISPNVTLKKAA